MNQMIDDKNLCIMLSAHADEAIDVRNGKSITPMDVIKDIEGCLGASYTRLMVNFYREKEEEKARWINAGSLRKKAAKKILFLNSVCTNHFSLKPFIVKRIDLNDDSAVEDLCDEFDRVLRTSFR